jgi:hypothetical protein
MREKWTKEELRPEVAPSCGMSHPAGYLLHFFLKPLKQNWEEENAFEANFSPETDNLAGEAILLGPEKKTESKQEQLRGGGINRFHTIRSTASLPS